MISYMLKEAAEPSAEGAVVVSVGPDEISCQSEVLAFLAIHLASGSTLKGRILGFYQIDKTYTKESWLSELPEDVRQGALIAKAGIEKHGFKHFHHGELELDKKGPNMMMRMIGRQKIVEQFSSRIDIDTSIGNLGGREGMKLVLKKMGVGLEESVANPLHAGIHPDFPASVNEEIWIQDAISSLKAMGADKWMRTMIKVLRDYLGGRPKEVVPNKNDRCPCKSGKKYGKCCGLGTLESDPEDCKLGRHTFGDWSAGNGGKFIRGCEKCLKIDEAPYGEEVLLGNGTKVILIGCRTCTKAPEPEDARKAVSECGSWLKCGLCGNPFKIDKAVCAHQVSEDGTHIPEWKLTYWNVSTKTVKCRYTKEKGEESAVLAHQDCWEATFRYATEKDGLVITTKKKDSKS
jgi:hypothetical protein